MNWGAHSWLYQILHPWHWLTYGQNTAAVGVIGLFLYVIYTRRMMKVAEETRRLSLTPFLVGTIRNDEDGGTVLVITNVAAPAVNCSIWGQPVTDDFELHGLFLVNENSKLIVPQYRPAITATAPLVISIPETLSSLCVIECYDTSGGRYQLQLRMRRSESGEWNVNSSFKIPDTFAPVWQRARHRMIQHWQLYRRQRRQQAKP